ncbi:MAG: LytTR family DNA-binding domain-containing protein [Bacteroidales bacterium]|nr:LytTR family DNA-binding domain-containing protein [Bacteroidales bacterium]
MITCIIVDDEPLAVSLMETYVRKTPFLELRGSFTSASAAFRFLQEHPTDLLFCDIQMPNLSGMELSRMLPGRTRVIFTTAFSQYALEGFKVHALDYLLKPVSYADFLAAATHAQTVIGASAPGAESAKKSIFVKTEYRLQQIELERITFIEGLKDYMKINTDDGNAPILTLVRMKSMEEQLPGDQFVRVHRSYIVNVRKIDAIERNHIIMGKERIPIGESYQDALYRTLSGSALLPG